MDAGEHEATVLWREIEELLAGARRARPLHQSDALLDLDRVSEDAAAPLLRELAHALDGWDGRLLLRAPDDALAPEVRAGDRLVIAPACEAGDGALVVAVAAHGPIVRRLLARGGRIWLEAGSLAPLALGPLVAILGVVVELRRTL